MATNLEIKCPFPEPAEGERMAKALGAEDGGVLTQRDTYFAVPSGRLKLRERAGAPAELIQYDRGEEGGERTCDYVIYRTETPALLGEALSRGLGVRCVVRKRRRLFLLNGDRIHLDEVEGLGNYLEFEVVYREGDTPATAQSRLNRLIEAFGLDRDGFIRGSYADLLADVQR